jgi:hypothetical protein
MYLELQPVRYPTSVPRPSPFARGFRVLRREPAALLAEIAWRWLFGGIATALFVWATLGFLHAIEVSKANQFLLRTLNPAILSYVLRDLFSQKWGLAARLAAIVSLSLSFLWILTSAIARSAIVRVLVEQVAEIAGEARETTSNLGTLLMLQSMRITLLWIGGLAYVVIAIICGLITRSEDHPQTGAFLLLFLVFFGISAAFLSFLNWVLHLAPIYAVRDGLSFGDAILAAWRLTRTRGASFTALNLAHLALRLIWFVFMSGVAFVPLGFAQILPKFVILPATLAITLVYCAVADALFIARYAGYIEVAEQELHPEPETPPLPPRMPIYSSPALDPSITPFTDTGIPTAPQI